MEISWLGHSCFRIRSGQTTIVTDPFPSDLGYNLGKQLAHIVTVSHQHPNHAFAEGVGGEPRVIRSPGEYEISSALIMGLAAFHDDQRGAERGKNTIYLIEIDGISVCHLGDIGHPLSAAHLEEMEEVDILLIPVGGVTTIGAVSAAEIIRRVEPRVAIPMHYGTPVVSGLDPVDKFLREMGQEQVEAQPKLTVSRSGMQAGGTQVCVLDYKEV
ncbi:MBL fold metallo-hydrolase [Chloroflexota bacterium]